MLDVEPLAIGVARLDTVTGSAEPLASAAGVQLEGFERIRWVRGSLVGIQRAPDGGLRAVRVKIENGRATAMEILDGGITATDHPVATVSGDEFYLLVHQADGNANDVVIRRSLVR